MYRIICKALNQMRQIKRYGTGPTGQTIWYVPDKSGCVCNYGWFSFNGGRIPSTNCPVHDNKDYQAIGVASNDGTE